MATLAERIKQLRNEKDLTQEEFGEIFGIVKSTVSLYESEKSTPDDDMKKGIAEYFDVSLDYLMGVSNIRNPYTQEYDKAEVAFQFNKELLSSLLIKAQGKRSLNQFGLSCKVDSGYLSRLINLKKDSPPSPEVLKKIADVAQNNVTYFDLMVASGYINVNDESNILPNYLIDKANSINQAFTNDINLLDIAKARAKMPTTTKEKMMNLLKLVFEEYFE